MLVSLLQEASCGGVTRHQAWLLLLLGSHRCLFYMFIISIEYLFIKYNTHYTAFHGQNNFA